MPATPLEALAEELGTISGQFERETRLRLAAAIADLQRHEAERELRFSKIERQIDERLASLKDGDPGKSISVDDVTPVLVAEIGRRFAELPKPKDGDNGKDADVNLITDTVRAAVAALPPPKDGKDADLSIVPDDVAEQVSKALALLAESPQINSKSPPIILNISSAERSQKSRKTITTRRNADGNMVADVVEE